MSPVMEKDHWDGTKAGEDPIRLLRAFNLTVAAVQKLSPSFRRLTFTGPDLELFGTGPGGATLDLRVKVMIPSPGHRLPELRAVRGSLLEDWYQNWRTLDESARGTMRTYTVRSLSAATPGSRGPELDIDFVLHGAGPAAGDVNETESAAGPAAQWAASASVGDPLLVIGPCTRWGDCLGIAFAPGEAKRVLLVGDETAVPAIASILEELPVHVGGHAVLEVPDPNDFQDLETKSNVEVRWRARNGRPQGEAMSGEVRALIKAVGRPRGEDPEDVDVHSALLWEAPAAVFGHGLYAWIAGEASTVKDLRRYLVRDVGMDRHAVAFMGYWRQGQAPPE